VIRLALVAGLVGIALVNAQAKAVAPAPSRVQVVAREYSFSLSRVRVHAGTAVIELANFGQDIHDLRVQRIGGKHIAGLADVAAGGRADLTVRLAPGRYSFWCSVANHRQLGMHTTLIVTR
jgi:plastocyanin